MSAVGLDYVLKNTDMSDLSEVLTEICNKWEQLASALDLPKHLVAQCRKDTFILSMNSVLGEWIAGNGVEPITLGTLKRKLESGTVGEKTLAKDLIAKFNIQKFGAEAAPSEATPPGHVPGSASTASPSLTTDDVVTVYEEVTEAKAKWKFIGLKLGVSPGELAGIESNGKSIDDKLMDTLTKWLESRKNTTWKALAEAMGSKSVQRLDLKSAILASHPC